MSIVNKILNHRIRTVIFISTLVIYAVLTEASHQNEIAEMEEEYITIIEDYCGPVR